jgi:hypothetical protein
MTAVSPTPDPDARRFLFRRAAIAPLCLCLVAGLQLARVATCSQTQWKGGGFGMFSTVDSEAARFVRAFAITSEGELPLAIPQHLEKTVAELRAAPTQAKLDEVARRLAAIRWRRPDERLIREARRALPETISAVSLPLPVIGLDRSLESIPSSEPPDFALPVSAVRVECWRLRLDSKASTLRGDKIREATAEVLP